MKAAILVGGRATRLLPLTVNTPKAMMPVLNVPFLEHVISHLGEHGIREIVLAQGHLAKSIEGYIGDGSQFGVHIVYSTEREALGSAGAVKNAERFLDETTLVMNADVFSDLDFTAMLDLHRRTKSLVTIATTPVDDPTRYGLVESDGSGRVKRFLEKPRREEATTNMINAGAWFVEAEVMALVEPGRFVSFEKDIFPALLAQGKVMHAFALDGYWIDMGTPETYLQLHRDLLSGKSKRYRPASGATRSIGDGCIVDPTARITDPVVIGPACSIGAGVTLNGPVVMEAKADVQRDALLENCIIWRNARIGRGAVVRNSILADGCVLEDGCTVDGAVLGDGAVIAAAASLPPGTKVEPGMRWG